MINIKGKKGRKEKKHNNNGKYINMSWKKRNHIWKKIEEKKKNQEKGIREKS